MQYLASWTLNYYSSVAQGQYRLKFTCISSYLLKLVLISSYSYIQNRNEADACHWYKYDIKMVSYMIPKL
jgi:hypothetical protein